MKNLTHCIALFLVVASLALCTEVKTADAKDYFLTIGGGYSPSGNQISLEKNILYFQDALASMKPNVARHDIFFADGDDAGRDLQFADPASVPEANELMAEILGRMDDIELVYRNHDIPGVRGKSSPKNFDTWLELYGKKMAAGDRLFLYATAHGGKSKDKKKPTNTKLYMWGNKSIRVDELVKKLGRLPKNVQVVLVMVQCYSGGFANTIFENGDPKKEILDRNICGFFSTVHTRQAAGCTPDIDEENYEEYSTYFWAALCGKTRLGKKITRPDYNRDGSISFEEAHAYVLMNSNTIDIPIKTSGTFLRKYAKTKDSQTENESGETLLTANSSYIGLIDVASSTDALILEALSEQLELTRDDRGAEVKELAKRIQAERSKLAKQADKKEDTRDKLRKQIAKRLKTRWPELTNTLSKTATELLTKKANEFTQAVKTDSAYSRYASLGAEANLLDDKRLDLERKWAKCQRVVRLLENVALTHNLPLLADSGVVQRYAELLDLEQSKMSTAGEAN